MPPRYHQLATLAASPSDSGQLTMAEGVGLSEIGLSVQGYARYFTLLEGLAALSFLTIATVAYLLRRQEWLPLLFAYGAAGFGLFSSPLSTGLEAEAPAWMPLLLILRSVVMLCFVLAILRFPDGRYLPPWTRWLGIMWTAYVVLALAIPGLRLQSSLVWNSIQQVLVLSWVLVWLAVITVVQVVRYRRYSTPIKRRQTRWVVWGLALGMGAVVVASVPVLLMPLLGGSIRALMAARMVAFTVVLLASIGMAACFGVAILYARLWDIDVVINRTLVYTLLTGLLALIYGLTVVLLQGLLGLFGADQNQTTVVLSTLLIAALFHPLRGRVQAFIDRRFYRRKYDAEQTLARFGTVARDEVDLSALTAELLNAVEQSVQPTQTSLWLKDNQP